MAVSEAAVRTFFSSPSFAVVGASSDPSKFGHKIFNWYIYHKLPVVPVNARASSIEAASTESAFKSQTYATLPDLTSLTQPKETSVSIVTPPPVTRKVLEEAKSLGVPAVWLQPGTYDDEILKFALEEFEGGVGGPGGYGHGGWCVLVDGEAGLQAAGKLEGRL